MSNRSYYLIVILERTSCIARKNIDESKKVSKHCIEQQQDSINGNWESFGATEHTKETIQLDSSENDRLNA